MPSFEKGKELDALFERIDALNLSVTDPTLTAEDEQEIQDLIEQITDEIAFEKKHPPQEEKKPKRVNGPADPELEALIKRFNALAPPSSSLLSTTTRDPEAEVLIQQLVEELPQEEALADSEELLNIKEAEEDYSYLELPINPRNLESPSQHSQKPVAPPAQQGGFFGFLKNVLRSIIQAVSDIFNPQAKIAAPSTTKITKTSTGLEERERVKTAHTATRMPKERPNYRRANPYQSRIIELKKAQESMHHTVKQIKTMQQDYKEKVEKQRRQLREQRQTLRKEQGAKKPSTPSAPRLR